ncbi:TrmJ/YjtD family RNA methyltransferase [Methanobrevibacter sp. OttesenSCG-928-K11]|nr:TrmJ/YjtD family RNA methyltransferase [Methanobrevibacter sp. OttesenSCG-928-K11]MDL2270497.1 TrmJ/YjtD family RNA methyltransferase [Methanobrevibacter sp. OttesenSCG-928-I08]
MVKIGDIATDKEVIVESNQLTNEKTEAKSEVKSKDNKKSKTKKEILITKMKESSENMKAEENIYIVFVECKTPGNVGFLARAMANFGLKNLVLINPCELKKEAYYQAMHGREIVESALIYNTLDEFLSSRKIDFTVASTGMPGGSYNLSRIPIKAEELGKTINFNYKTAILFGREGDGLTNKEIESCDMVVSIPTDPVYPIMNISHAAAIIFYEIFKNLNNFPVEGLEEATAIEKELLFEDMEYLISKLDLPKHKEKTGLKSFKNIVNRSFITGREAHTLKGILRKLKLKLK